MDAYFKDASKAVQSWPGRINGIRLATQINGYEGYDRQADILIISSSLKTLQAESAQHLKHLAPYLEKCIEVAPQVVTAGRFAAACAHELAIKLTRHVVERTGGILDAQRELDFIKRGSRGVIPVDSLEQKWDAFCSMMYFLPRFNEEELSALILRERLAVLKLIVDAPNVQRGSSIGLRARKAGRPPKSFPEDPVEWCAKYKSERSKSGGKCSDQVCVTAFNLEFRLRGGKPLSLRTLQQLRRKKNNHPSDGND